MGSFANSLHVRSDDAEAVAVAVRESLENQGYAATAGESGEVELTGLGTAVRCLRVAEASKGWVGIVDSDLMGMLTLAQDLSFRLQTHAIGVMVNDSDSWHYELFHRGQQVDGFDSAGAEPLLDLDELPAEMLEMPDAGELAKAMESVMEQMPGMAELFQSLLPPDMRELSEKITAGTATPEEAAKFSEWTKSLAEEAAEEFGDQFDELDAELPVAAKGSDGNGRAASKSELEGHLHHLRPILVEGTADEVVGGVLTETAMFAEEPMADFLELLDVHRMFASLSFDYLGELSAEDLAAEGLVFGPPLLFAKS